MEKKKYMVMCEYVYVCIYIYRGRERKREYDRAVASK